MNPSFETDPHPGRPKILFIGPGDSSHTYSWIDLLADRPFNVRFFVPPRFFSPPDSWKIKTYITAYDHGPLDRLTRKRLVDKGTTRRVAQRYLARALNKPWDSEQVGAAWLAQIIREWQPHIVHTFQVDVAEFYFRVCRDYGIENGPKWVLQVRGGPELAMRRLMPEHKESIRRTLLAGDQVVADNQQNYEFALEMGVKQDQISLGVVPGTGGIDVMSLVNRWRGNPSERRILLWPKAYEGPQNKALPVLEALKLAKARMPPCEIHLVATNPEVRMWFQTLPADLREACVLYERAPRDQVLELMVSARIMLAPSVSDGVPNAMYEAMAAGAFPIISPLDTVVPLVREEENVLFARNLYPEEIAGALVRAATDDRLVDTAAKRNLELVKRLASRDEIRERVIRFYESLAGTPAALLKGGKT